MAHPIQTRSELNGLTFWSTLDEAKDAASTDETIWKISYTGEDGVRVRLVRQENGTWKDEPLMDAVNVALGKDFC